MKDILLLLAVLIIPYMVSSQTCEPDTTFPDSVTGVFPAPITPDNPDGGIDLPACPGEYYEYTLTVIIPDSAMIPIGGVPIAVDIISAQINEEGAIDGLPPGIDYLCMPENCIFPDKETGCLLLYGTVEEGTSPGKYPLSISLQITLEGIGTIDVEFPGQLFPGEYYLEVADPDSSICMTSASQSIIIGHSFFPNPISSNQNLRIQNTVKIQNLEIRNINGTLTDRFKRVPRTISLQQYPTGLYLLNYEEDGQLKYQKLVVQY